MNKPKLTGEYLFIVTYEDDSERKRVEYLFNNWAEGTIEHPDGLVRLAEGVDHEQIYEQLVTKVPEDQISTYAVEPVETDVEPTRLTVEQKIDAPESTVKSFVEYVLSKRKAVLQDSERNEYEVYSKKGRAHLRYTLSESSGETTVRLVIEGYQPAPSFLSNFFEQELTEFAESQQ